MPGEDSARDRAMFAVFREETSTGVGDPYKAPDPLPERWRGKQFATCFPASGTGPDAMIDKSIQLSTRGDHYIDPFMVERKLNRSLEKPFTGKSFMPAAPAPKSSGPGSMYGLLSPPILDTDPSRSPKASESTVAGKRNIYVSPPKRGTYGFPWQDRSIGQSKFEHMADEYNPGQQISRALKAEARARIPKAFVATGRTNKGIAPITNYVAGEDTKPAPPPENTLHGQKWKPTNPTQRGHGNYGCLNKLEYVPQLVRKVLVTEFPKGFVPPSSLHNRLSMRAVNPYAYEALPPKDNHFSLLA